jgi:DNA-binding PadR family transcriptional regulator
MGRPGEFELLVLLAALRLGPDEAYAVSIAREIEARTGRRVRRANVYTALQRLEEKGFVASRMSEPRQERGGKARRLVALKADGVVAVRDATTDLRAMLGGLEDVLEAAG